MTTPVEVVRSFFERMEARDWEAAAALVDPLAGIEYTATGESFTGAGFVAMNEAYPEGWSITVADVLAEGNRVAAQVRVDHGETVFGWAGFYSVADGQIRGGTEHWVTAGGDPAPGWRAAFRV